MSRENLQQARLTMCWGGSGTTHSTHFVSIGRVFAEALCKFVEIKINFTSLISFVLLPPSVYTVDALLVPAGTNKIGDFFGNILLSKIWGFIWVLFKSGYYSRAGTNNAFTVVCCVLMDRLSIKHSDLNLINSQLMKPTGLILVMKRNIIL